MKSLLTSIVIVLTSLFCLNANASMSTDRPEYNDWTLQRSTIVKASVRANVSPSTMAAMAYVETRFQPRLKNKTTGAAKGMFQFDNPTWQTMLRLYGRQYGYNANTSVYDPMANALMAAELYKHNRKLLEKTLKRKVTDEEVYMAHFLGIGGATKMLKANGNRLARDVTPKQAKYNRSHFYANGKPHTVNEFKRELHKFINAPKRIYGPEAEAYALMKHNFYYVG